MLAVAGQEVRLVQRVQKRRQVPVVHPAAHVLVVEVLDYAVLAVLAAVQEVGIRGLHTARAVVVVLHRPQEQDRCSQQQGQRARSIDTSGTCGPASVLSSSPCMLCISAPRRSATARNAGIGEGRPLSGR